MPLLAPEAPEVMVKKLSLLAAVHAQPAGVAVNVTGLVAEAEEPSVVLVAAKLTVQVVGTGTTMIVTEREIGD